MSKKFVKFIAIIIALALIITSFSFVFFMPGAYAATKETQNVYATTLAAKEAPILASLNTNTTTYLKHRMEIMQSYFEFLHKYFKDEVDYEFLTKAAMDGATDALGDQFTDFYIYEEEKEAFESAVSNEYAGVGVTMQEQNGKKIVISVNPFGPAYAAGVKAGDVFTNIAGKSAEDMTINDISNALRGEPGTNVTFVVDRNGQSLTFTITRAKIDADSIAYEVINDNVGYMKVASFDANTAEEFKLAKIDLVNHGADSLLIDLRDNGGGYIQSAIDMADQLLSKGSTITHYARKGEVLQTQKSTGAITSELPVVLLVNENSASATELFAGAMQDNKAATLVGTTTFGKGVAQQLVTLEGGDSAKVSIFYFLTPNKHDIDKVGITPDVVVRNGEINSAADIETYKAFAPMSEEKKPKVGDIGLNVYGAQQRLAFLGYFKGDVTGTMDAATGEAVKKFQKDEGLYPYATLDFSTMSKLETAAYNKAYGVYVGEDHQLNKALEILKK